MRLHVRRSCSENLGRVLQHPDSCVAGLAQDATNNACSMMVINVGFLRNLTADGTHAALRDQHCRNLLRRQATTKLEVLSVAARRGAIRRSSVAGSAVTTAPSIPHIPVVVPSRTGIHLSTPRGLLGEWIAVGAPRPPVLFAPSSGQRGLCTSINRARNASVTEVPSWKDLERIAVLPPAHVVRLAPAAHLGGRGALRNAAQRRIELHQRATTSLVWPAVVQGSRRPYFTEASPCR